ncbi:MAG: hypothetical protein DRN59_01720 [Thaumarchaeota archaeon]|nr:MAG: hypothetical protein DRN59_01720 [Nitrososphaerota archaeon]
MVLQKLSPIICLLLLSSALLAGVASAEEKPLVIATTSILGSVIEDLAGDKVQLIILVSPSICPAHYDVKPSDVYAVSEARLIFYHGMERWLDQLYEVSGSKAKLIKISGDWTTPDGIKTYYRKVAEALESELGIDVSDKLESRLSEIDRASEEILRNAERSGVSEIGAIVMSWQKGFVEWMGFKVVGEFGPPEKLSSADIEKLIVLGEKNDVRLVISNLQSGTHVGETIAEELNAVHVVLSNFPGTDPETRTLIDLMRAKADRLLEAIKLLDLKRSMASMETTIEFYQAVVCLLIIIVAVEALAIIYLVRRMRRA